MDAQPFPPAGFVEAESTVDGILVYRPAPEDAGPERAVVDFSCPRCGGTTAYSVAGGGLRCEYCGYYEAPERQVVGKGAREFEFKVETMERAAHGWGTERKDLSCEGCGAHVSVPPRSMTVSCPFCGSSKLVQTPGRQDALRPRFLVPFEVTDEACRRTIREWLGSSWMVPGDLQRLAGAVELTSMYLPTWTFDGVARARWRAQVGHTKTERYRSGGEWKTRTRTEWRWESGNVTRAFDDLPIPGTARLSQVLLERIKDYDLSGLAAYDPQFLAGSHAQAYDVPLEEAWEAARHRMREATRAACRDQASTSKIRNFSMELDFSDESWRYILVPAYVGAYRYGGDPYQLMVNGQTAEVAGQRPVDWTKVGLAIGAALAPGVLITLAGLVTILLGIGAIVAGVGMVVLIIGIIIGFLIFQKARRLDDV
jgi:DNA-directed RNA polymerase subunit RPC12/RpoP